MSKTTNVGICVENNKIFVYNVGFERTTNNPCTGEVILEVMPQGKNTQIKSSNNIIFDPRGLNISLGGNICIDNNKFNRYYIICVSRGAIRADKGEGTCPSSCS
jgi:phage pi2 protein 07